MFNLYFSKVVNGKTQKKQFTISGFDRDWLIDLIKYNKFSKSGSYTIIKGAPQSPKDAPVLKTLPK